jgi:hypothetical protein
MRQIEENGRSEKYECPWSAYLATGGIFVLAYGAILSKGSKGRFCPSTTSNQVEKNPVVRSASVPRPNRRGVRRTGNGVCLDDPT